MKETLQTSNQTIFIGLRVWGKKDKSNLDDLEANPTSQ